MKIFLLPVAATFFKYHCLFYLKPKVLPRHDDLIGCYKKGEVLSFKQLYKRYSKAMVNACLCIINNKIEKEYALQQIFTAAFKSLQHFEYHTGLADGLPKFDKNYNSKSGNRTIRVKIKSSCGKVI